MHKPLGGCGWQRPVPSCLPGLHVRGRHWRPRPAGAEADQGAEEGRCLLQPLPPPDCLPGAVCSHSSSLFPATLMLTQLARVQHLVPG